MTLRLTCDEVDGDGVRERRFVLDDVPGTLWTPPGPAPAPLLLLGHPGGLDRMGQRLAGRARSAAAAGFAAAALELPGSGGRARLPGVDAARAELREAVTSGAEVPDDVVDRLVLPLVDAAVPEHRAALDALLGLPGVRGPVAVVGGVTALGVRLALLDRRVAAAVLFAGSYVPRSVVEDARRLAVPVLVLLQWDDEGNDRRAALDLFDALGSAEKTLHANMGGHTGVPAFEADDVNRFLARHLT